MTIRKSALILIALLLCVSTAAALQGANNHTIRLTDAQQAGLVFVTQQENQRRQAAADAANGTRAPGSPAVTPDLLTPAQYLQAVVGVAADSWATQRKQAQAQQDTPLHDALINADRNKRNQVRRVLGLPDEP